MTTALLNNVDHGGLRVAIRHGAAFGDAVNQMLLLPTEFLEAQREFPILFRRSAEGWAAVALLGFDQDENLFLGEAGWSSRYVPAVQRRGPCLIGRDEAGEPKVRIALDDPRVGDGAGHPLFLPHGGEAPYLGHVRQALAQLHAGTEASPAMFAAFEAAGLVDEVRLDVEVDAERRYEIEGYWTIGAPTLAALDGDTLARLNADGYLALAFAVVASLGNVERLIELKRMRMPA